MYIADRNFKIVYRINHVSIFLGRPAKSFFNKITIHEASYK